jgi:bleomycin hydrolase
MINANMKEMPYDATIRQQLYENLTTQDDHLMHIVGVEKTKDGKTFFVVKNSWGKIGPFEGYINVSEGYFAINTISLVLPKAALSKELQNKLGLK